MKRLLLALILGLASAFAAATPNNFSVAPATVGGGTSYLRAIPAHVDVRVLAANTNEDHTVPSTARLVIFSSSCAAFYVKSGGTAAVPAADVTDGSGSALNPAGFDVEGITTIGLISPTACVITLEFYK